MAALDQRLGSHDRDSGGPPQIITTGEELAWLVDQLSAVPEYGLDTEFHRERTYWPRLALVQVAWLSSQDGQTKVALVDPLAVDPEPLAQVLAGPGVMVAHAATQDMEVLLRACRVLPARLFDTQVAAGFLGYGSASLASRCRTLPRCPPGQRGPPDRLEPAAPEPVPDLVRSCRRGALARAGGRHFGPARVARAPGLGGRGVRHRAGPSHQPH